MSRRWTGAKDAGSREFTPAEAERVVSALMRHVGPANAVSLEIVGQQCGVEGRTLRAAISALDGDRFVVGYDDKDRVFVCGDSYQAEHHTRKMEATARSLLERVQRRRDLLGSEPEQPSLL